MQHFLQIGTVLKFMPVFNNLSSLFIICQVADKKWEQIAFF